MKVHGAIKFGLPALLLAGVLQLLVPAQTGDPVIDYIGFIVPYIGEFLNFMQGFLVPIGATLGEFIIAPVVAIIPQNEPAGFAIYFMIFAGLFLVSMLMNAMWRPLGYKKTKTKKAKTGESAGQIEHPVEKSEDTETVETLGDE